MSMKTNWKQPKNYGWEDVDYDFGVDSESTKKISHILNEACHVFYYHADGHWKSSYKDKYALELAKEFELLPELSSRVLRSSDRVVKMIAFRALELLKES